MAEEHGFRASENHHLCLNNCGFSGSPATQNFCSKCYNDLFMNKDIKPTTKPVAIGSLPSASVASSPFPASSSKDYALSVPEVEVRPVAQPNRCSACRKKVGLMGFRCRCGITFCGTHRYPEQHRCSFDFKSMGREAIAKANPVVKAEKLEKI